MKINHILAALIISALPLAASAQVGSIHFLSGTHCMVRTGTADRYVLLPVQESAEISNIKLLAGGRTVRTVNVRMAVDKIDYYVPLEVGDAGQDSVMLDFHINGTERYGTQMKNHVCWKSLKSSNQIDMTNREPFRPQYHHTPAWGWMNDPNGMFYKDGVWHLYFQHNPYGSQWENLSWGHSTSTDLVNWKHEGEALVPDGLGMIFSGSCVVDSNNTAGFGKGAVVAFYTSAAESQTQSIAYSTDNGKTFTKYADNPILTSDVPDFRDPYAFWNDDIKKWNLILAAGQEMRIYTSDNLKTWHYESSFGEGYGAHGGVWECPDLMKLGDKWVLICNINPGGPQGGSATQYFVGQFDGHKFTCDDAPQTTKWLDWGKDHYATVTFNNAPAGRHVAMTWMSNWQYADRVPTKQYRSANGLPRDLGLFSYNDSSYVSVLPSPEVYKAFSEKTTPSLPACAYLEINNLRNNATVTLSNKEGEEVVIKYNAISQTLSMDRTKSGQTDFSVDFPCVTTAPTFGKARSLMLFIDASSLELFEKQGHVAMSNIVFPSSPYNKVTAKGCKVKIHALRD